jgi:hypothetical protein
MNDIIQQFIDEQPEVFPDETEGDGYRCSVTLKDGTFLPCVMLRESTAIVELAMRRFEEEREGRGLFGKPDMEAYRDIVRHFVTSGNRINGYDVASVEPSRYAFPMTLLQVLEGETTMAWTGFVLEMSDGRLFQYGTSYQVEFFDLPQGYEFSDVAKLHNHSYVNPQGRLSRLQEGYSEEPDDYDPDQSYREKPWFDCYTDGL